MGRSKIVAEVINKFLSATLEEISMLSCEVETKAEAMAAGPRKGALNFDASARVKGVIAEAEGLPVGMYTHFALEIFQDRKPTKKDPSPRTDLARISVGYASFFSVSPINKDAISEHECDEFAVTEGFRLIQPYIQQHMSEITGRLGFPPLLIPSGAIDVEIYIELES